MPFLRFSRDKRGYENTYLCHTYRRGGKPRLRVLYWFRTPPEVKVGRLALDPDAIRTIEESNPDLKFDWGKILKVKPPPPPPDYGADGRAARRERRCRRDPGAASAPPVPGASLEHGPAAAPESVVSVEEPGDPELTLDESAQAAAWDEADLGSEQDGPAEAPAHVVIGLTDDEGLARLRARHAELQARISDRFRDPAKLEELRAQAALLDPDAWRTVEEARERLASLDAATDAIRKVLGRRRRSRRGGARRRSRQQSGPGGVSESGDAEPAATPEATSPAASPPPSEAPADPPHE